MGPLLERLSDLSQIATSRWRKRAMGGPLFWCSPDVPPLSVPGGEQTARMLVGRPNQRGPYCVVWTTAERSTGKRSKLLLRVRRYIRNSNFIATASYEARLPSVLWQNNSEAERLVRPLNTLLRRNVVQSLFGPVCDSVDSILLHLLYSI